MGAAVKTESDMLDWMWGYVCNADDLIRQYAESDNCGSPELAAEWRAGFKERLRPQYHAMIQARKDA